MGRVSPSEKRIASGAPSVLTFVLICNNGLQERRCSGLSRIVMGDVACAMGAIDAGLKFYAGYPITHLLK